MRSLKSEARPALGGYARKRDDTVTIHCDTVLAASVWGVEIRPVKSLTTEDTEGHGGLQEEVSEVGRETYAGGYARSGMIR
jgi:hypothetical protein